MVQLWQKRRQLRLPLKLFSWRQWRSAWCRGSRRKSCQQKGRSVPQQRPNRQAVSSVSEQRGAVVTGTQQAGNPVASYVRETSETDGEYIFSGPASACPNARHHLPTTSLCKQSGHCPTGRFMAGQSCSAAVQTITLRPPHCKRHRVGPTP